MGQAAMSSHNHQRASSVEPEETHLSKRQILYELSELTDEHALFESHDVDTDVGLKAVNGNLELGQIVRHSDVDDSESTVEHNDPKDDDLKDDGYVDDSESSIQDDDIKNKAYID